MAERIEEAEGFLGRWSRLKREVRTEEPPPEPSMPGSPLPEPAGEASATLPAKSGEEAPELPDLPPLDSLDAGSDYTGFLRRDVPADLRRQALRKAWASDPVIAGFRGFAEYDWDYNAPGYGALRPTDDIARLLNAVLPDERREDEEAVEAEMADVGHSPQSSQTATTGGSEGLPVGGEDQLRNDVSPPLPMRHEASSDQAPIPSPPRGEG
ncbi:DUF3306 domain-containing protein [Azospirillum sp. YIM B02556]|uniref:DUF3306 domain-containing protein n=1 Tax=Azospirillum endophyticum TaxID=2800326 RepID=A0ABS1F4B6_9PROT|nr:DUF3306 domain-containing protein [Azospirillum endophyticum]MBK1838263.1 DUF3306 domain-containing protein [Azospirillum endophyticum]